MWTLERPQYEVVETVSQSKCPEILLQSARGEEVEDVTSRGRGCYVCEPVQEPSGWCMTTCTGCSTSLLWQSIVVFAIALHGTSPTVCQSPKFLVASICDLPEVIISQFHEFATAAVGPIVHFLAMDQQSGIHCLIICGVGSSCWLQTIFTGPEGLPDIRSVSTLEVFTYRPNRARHLPTYLLTYLLLAKIILWEHGITERSPRGLRQERRFD